MKEIDFIPEWYTADRVRRRKYVRLYTLMAILFAVMMLWSFVAGQHVRHAHAEVQAVQAFLDKANERAENMLEIEQEIAAMKQKTMLLDKITPRTKVTTILGELSYLIQDNILVSKLTFKNEPIEAPEKKPASTPTAVVQIGQSENKQDPVVPQTPVRRKIVLTGIALQPADAASLIARMEQTPYFDHVTLVFSKPKEVQEREMTEFEIQCYVADYQIRK